MKYRPELGIVGNIKVLFDRETNTNNGFINHKSAYDVDHIAMEQALTDADLNNIVAEQAITDLDIRVLTLESEE